MKLQEEALTYKLRGGFFHVQNEVGLGRSEEAYHRALCIWMARNGISFASKPVYPIHLKGMHVLDLIPDLVVEECLVIELKSKPHRLAPNACVQLYDYLKRTSLKLGLLVNMGLDRVYIERHFHDSNETNFRISGRERNESPTDRKLSGILEDLYAEHTTGYSSAISERLLNTALCGSQLPILRDPPAPNYFDQQEIGTSKLDCMIIHDDTVFCHTCLYDSNEFNLSRTRSFLKALGLHRAVAVNFGKRTLDVHFL